MNHCTEDDLILHYYGEESRRDRVEHHLDACEECAAAYRSLERTLQLVPLDEVPERGERYPAEVWSRIRGRLPERQPRPWTSWFAWEPLAVAAAIVALIVGAFMAGRTLPQRSPATPANAVTQDAPDATERVLNAAIGDHLERSERVLLDLVNADGERVDLSDEQMWASDLVEANRLYRDAAVRSGDELVAGVLDDLERSLLEVVHGPTAPTRQELDAARSRLDAATLLFKVRVLADELHEREVAPIPPRKTT